MDINLGHILNIAAWLLFYLLAFLLMHKQNSKDFTDTTMTETGTPA